jgi:hypothetical protein
MIKSLSGRKANGREVWSGILGSERLRLALLFLLGALSRLPFTSQILYHWDSVNFALALHHFDVAVDQPHIPGYILYVMLGRLVNYGVGDPQVTLVGISLVSSGLAVVALYILGRAMFSRETGLMAALFLAASPLFWFYGEIALPHSLDTLVVILVVWMLYRVMQGCDPLPGPPPYRGRGEAARDPLSGPPPERGRGEVGRDPLPGPERSLPEAQRKGPPHRGRGEVRLVLLAAVTLAIAGGLRPQTQVFLMPLALLAAWRLNRRQVLLAVVAMGFVDLLWFVPLMWSVGGLFRYFKIFSAFAGRFNETSSVFSAGAAGLQRNLRKLAMYTLYAGGLAFIPAIGYGLLRARRMLGLLQRRRLWFLFLWMAPSVLYYTFVHMGQQGLVFVFLPALLLIGAESLRRLAGRRHAVQWGVTWGLVVLQATIFLAFPTYPLGGDRFKILTWQTIRQHDQYYQKRLEVVRHEFPPDQTLIIGTNWRHLEYYLSDYPLIRLSVTPEGELGEGELMNTRDGVEIFSPPDLLGRPASSDAASYLVLFDDGLPAFLDTRERVLQTPLPGGDELMYLVLSPGERVYVDADSFGLLLPPPRPSP